MNFTRLVNFKDHAHPRRSLAALFKGRLLIILSLGCVCLASSRFLNAQCDQTCDTDGNTFLGSEAGVSTTAGGDNTGVGDSALFHNTLGRYNTAIGSHALVGNTTGEQNTAIGGNNLVRNTTGSYNTAIGSGALPNNNGSHNVAFGQNTLLRNERGSNNIAIGPAAGLVVKNGSWNIHIGSKGPGGEQPRDEEQTIRIGDSQMATYIAGISGTTVASGAAVFVDSNGQLGTMTSSERFKEEIKPMNKISEAIFSLEPVTFRYKQEMDAQHVPQFGLVAEDVEKINPDLVVRDKQGRPYTVRYEAVNAMLLNEFLKEHCRREVQDDKIQEQDATIAQLKSGIEALAATVKEQAAQIQKVSAQLELKRTAPQMVLNTKSLSLE